MEYSNQVIPEGINTSQQNELTTFLKLLIALVVFLLVGILCIAFSSEILVRQISYRHEKQWFSDNFEQLTLKNKTQTNAADEKIRSYLQSLADQVSQAQQFPKDYNITVHYTDADTVNAFATIGGHIFLFKGLLEKLPDEHALLMLIGHEVAHVKNRDPIVSLARVLGIQIFLSMVLGNHDLLQDALGQSSQFGLLKFSRKMEAKADSDALSTLQKIQNNCSSATSLFKVLKAEHATESPIDFLSSHPNIQSRIDAIKKHMKTLHCKTDKPATALPTQFASWLMTKQENIKEKQEKNLQLSQHK